ncbi:hypothetical protein MMC21_007608 [Puttea exsequens]|nr:hypothetical protein [Puttea exsequens]
MVDGQHEQLHRGRTTATVCPSYATEANPWLERVQWPEPLAGHDMHLTPLVLLPGWTECILPEWERALGGRLRRNGLPAKDQLTKAERVLYRPFDAADPPAADLCTSPVLRYRLEAVRLATLRHGLAFQLTLAQRYWFHHCSWLAYRRHYDRRCDKRSRETLMWALCQLNIYLIDHPLDGRLRESVVVNFLALNGFDQANGTF